MGHTGEVALLAGTCQEARQGNSSLSPRPQPLNLPLLLFLTHGPASAIRTASCSGSLYRRNCSTVQLVSQHRPHRVSGSSHSRSPDDQLVVVAAADRRRAPGSGTCAASPFEPRCLTSYNHQPVCSRDASRLHLFHSFSVLQTYIYKQNTIISSTVLEEQQNFSINK